MLVSLMNHEFQILSIIIQFLDLCLSIENEFHANLVYSKMYYTIFAQLFGSFS